MRFESVHSYKAPADAVGSALVDPAFYAELDLPDVGRPRLDAHTRDGAVHRLVTTWVYSGELDPLARRVVGSHKISWSQTLVFDEATMTGSLDITSAIQPGRISCRASVNVIAAGQRSSRRTIRGELKIGIPLIGGKAESALVPGILARLDREGDELGRWLRRPGS